MHTLIALSLEGLAAFALYFALGIVALIVGVALYIRITPHAEVELVRDNNVAAAVAMMGGIVGIAIPLSRVVSQSVNPVDLAVWAVIALAAQLVTFVVARAVFPRLPQRIRDGQVAPAIVYAGMSISVGMLNAAAMTV